MQEHKYKHRHSHKKDGIDNFREQSLKAIQRKKLYAKVAYIVGVHHCYYNDSIGIRRLLHRQISLRVSCKNHAGEHLKILI